MANLQSAIGQNVIRVITAVILLCLLSAHSLLPNDLAYIIEGEAGNCAYEAKVAIAWVHSRNDRMLGWEVPSNESKRASILWFYYRDPTKGANHVFSADDLLKADVKEIIGDSPHTAFYPCSVGGLYFFKL